MPRGKRRLLLVGLALVLSGCLGRLLGGGELLVDPVQERGVIAFAERIERFYAALEKVPLDSLMTYENARLRTYFAGPREFSDYFASLANLVRRSPLRHATAERVEIREFRFPDAERAEVDLLFVGPRARALLFWDVELRRTDTWRRVGDTWLLSPERF